MTTFLQTLMSGLSVGALYALIALGYTMVYGVLQFINFAHSDVFMLGAWLSFWLATKLKWTGTDAQPSFFRAAVVMLGAMAMCAVIGLVIERLAYRPLRNAPRLNVLITAIGVSLFIQNLGQLPWVFGTDPQPFPRLLQDYPLATVAGVEIHFIDAIIIVGALTLMVALNYIVYGTRMGLAMRAVAADTRTASLMGVNIDRTVATTFIIGSALAGAAGFLFGVKYNTLNHAAFPTWTLYGLKAFVAAVVGGIGNIRGAMLGGLLIGLVENFAVTYGSTTTAGVLTSEYRDIYVFAILILVLLVKPTGILGRKSVEKV